jgi:hypothetical protein
MWQWRKWEHLRLVTPRFEKAFPRERHILFSVRHINVQRDVGSFMSQSEEQEFQPDEGAKAADVFISTQLLVLLERIKLKAEELEAEDA